MENTERPLCIDLDGTLIKTDAFIESGFSAFAKEPVNTILYLARNFKNPAPLKEYAYQIGGYDAATAPYAEEIIKFAKEQKNNGRTLILATASNEAIANAVNNYLGGLFDTVLASDGERNLRGSNKARALIEAFGEKGFDYMGNDRTDIKIWQHAHTAYLVNCNTKLADGLNAQLINTDFAALAGPSRGKAFQKALRTHQWMKNVLLFVAPIAAHKLDAFTIISALIAFIAFSLMSSAGYVINDLFDVADDRLHPEKKHRPFASGVFSPQQGLAIASALFVVSLLISLTFLPPAFSLTMLAYFIATTLYSVFFKSVLLIDVYTLGSFFTLRVIAGGIATSVAVSMWLLSFIWLFFTGLAFLKRFTELDAVQRGRLKLPNRRQYKKEDVLTIEILGICTSALTIPILALYAASEDALKLYSNISLLWLAVPLFWAWQSRIWLIAHRGNMTYDPVEFALYDRVTHFCIIAILSIMWFAR